MSAEPGLEITKPVQELSQLEALVLLNRWAKSNRFYHADRDKLYLIKDIKIAEFTGQGLLIPTCILRRETPAIQGMRTEIANGGQNLSVLNLFNYDAFSELSSGHYDVLMRLVEDGVEVPVSPAEAAARKQVHAQEQQEYEAALNRYRIESKAYKEAQGLYQQALIEYRRELYQSFTEFLEQQSDLTKSEKKLRSNLSREPDLGKVGKGRQNQIQTLMVQRNFRPESRPPKRHIKEPQKPAPPELRLADVVKVEDYQIGMLPEVDAAIEWLRAELGNPGLMPTEFDTEALEQHLSNTRVKRDRAAALAIFRQVVEGRLTDPREIWEQLTVVDLDFEEAIGMAAWRHPRFLETTHREYGKWHEINLSPTGHWLLEFQSAQQPEIVLHVPYDRRSQLELAFHWDTLPLLDADQEKFGREISPTEQSAYPLPEVLRILGYTPAEFPYELQPYRRAPRYSYTDFDDDFDNVFGDDEEYNPEAEEMYCH